MCECSPEGKLRSKRVEGDEGVGGDSALISATSRGQRFRAAKSDLHTLVYSARTAVPCGEVGLAHTSL